MNNILAETIVQMLFECVKQFFKQYFYNIR